MDAKPSPIIVAPTIISGIQLYANSTLDVRGLKIHGNVIVSPLETQIRTANSSSIGIGWISVGGRTLEDSDISENTLINFPMAGIRLRCNVKGVRVSGNTLINTGSTLDTSVYVAYRCPIFVGTPASLSTLLLDRNVIIDNLATTRMVYAMYVNAVTFAEQFRITDNVIQATGATQTAYQQPIALVDNVAKPYLRAVISSFITTNAKQFAPGSQVTDPSNGRVYRLAADNVTWIYKGVGLEAIALADLGAPANGTVIYCSDCANASNPCTGTSTGAVAKRLNGAWDCR